MANYSNEANGAIDLLVALGSGSFAVAVNFIDGNSEICLTTLTGREAGKALSAIGVDQLRVKADSGMLEVCTSNGVSYFNLYL